MKAEEFTRHAWLWKPTVDTYTESFGFAGPAHAMKARIGCKAIAAKNLAGAGVRTGLKVKIKPR